MRAHDDEKEIQLFVSKSSPMSTSSPAPQSSCAAAVMKIMCPRPLLQTTRHFTTFHLSDPGLVCSATVAAWPCPVLWPLNSVEHHVGPNSSGPHEVTRRCLTVKHDPAPRRCLFPMPYPLYRPLLVDPPYLHPLLTPSPSSSRPSPKILSLSLARTNTELN